MTECKSSFLQLGNVSVLHCKDPCLDTSFITFNQDDLKQKVGKLQSTISHRLMKENFKDLSQGSHVPQKWKGVKQGQGCGAVPTPARGSKRNKKCSMKENPNCPVLAERFLGIQTGLQGELEKLKQDIEDGKASCKERLENIAEKIRQDKQVLAEAQVQLATAAEKIANAGEQLDKATKD